MPSLRYKLTVAYDGTDFHGWQRQEPPGEEPLRTVQGVLEDAVRRVVREPVHVVGASRTDSGVHARGQVAAFTTEATLDRVAMGRALNARLPDDVQVVRVARARADFDPIADAIDKGYRYVIAHGTAGTAPRPLFDRRFVTICPRSLDAGAMHAAARHLVGTHDFASLTRLHHGRESTVRTIHDCAVTATSRHRLRIDVSGNGFLYNMVRIIAGTLVDVGTGKVAAGAIPDILAARDRTAAGPTLPPEGLCLMWIKYGKATAGRGDGATTGR